MSFIGHTSGGSPIFHNRPKKQQHKVGKTLYKCSEDDRHKLTVNQAKKSGYMCTHCGAELKVRKHKIAEFNRLKEEIYG